MKIGVETIYEGYNFGCFLQAYAMQKFLQAKGHDVVILDHSTFKERISRRYFAKSLGRTILKLRRYCVFSKSWNLLKILKFSDVSSLDITIIGSDEVWNVENPSFDHRPQFYGLDCKSKKIIAYGPSLGNSSYDSYLWRQELLNGIKNNIGRFLVRDKFTADFLQQLGINDTYRVCDPTFLIYNQWESLRQSYLVEPEYLLYYSYHEDTPYKEYISRFAKENGLKVIVAGFDYQWCDERLIINPFQFLDIVAKAKYVVTSTFHGTIFSIVFKKRFVVIHPNDKVIDLLCHYGLESRYFAGESSYNHFSSISKQSIDYDTTFNHIEIDSKISSNALLQSL